MTHPIDQYVTTDGPTLDVLLAPVRCIDCTEFVPLGWVEFGTVICPASTKDGGSPWGHRVRNTMPTHVRDTVANKLAAAGVGTCDCHTGLHNFQNDPDPCYGWRDILDVG